MTEEAALHAVGLREDILRPCHAATAAAAASAAAAAAAGGGGGVDADILRKQRTT